MFSLTFQIDNAENLYKAILPEEASLQTKRATVTMSFDETTKQLNINLQAQDFPAFRAIETGIMRLLVTHNKVTTVINND
jgi:tRNA threonylcarbamoyladenosine modification (KEOPS) complex  Pcc1 subunit